MDPITLEPNPAKGHSSEYTLRVASAIAEAVRVLNYATFAQNAPDGMPYPSTSYDVIGRLQAATAGMGQLFGQLADRLADLDTTQEITVSHGLFADDTDAAVDQALEALATCAHVASDLDDALRFAHAALSPLGLRLPADPEDGRRRR
ncbi:hypothetical protein BKA00_004311 [Actinomadura coerulea]|uniref:Uncharacterized protein n=1 Tax=Actinomadura coerulea TaxID=46159 RepID=A0A7X0L0E0_9ACTN|nr:hypothetical protein [Actinomadura coerulea]MBB6397397.1 hypothetical protein [Actinomadura coerulea]GGQ02372.1 hypothetical protein GCM10010187_17620 [Actinomadura coerulea]